MNRELGPAKVDAGAIDFNTHPLRVGNVLAKFGDVPLCIKQCRIELCRVVTLEVGHFKGHLGIGNGVGAVEPIIGKLVNVVKHLTG